MDGQGRIAKQVGGKGFYALVNVMVADVASQSPTTTIDPSADDDWQRAEGWTDAAIVGAELGMKLARCSADCTITRVHGMPCDTNSTLVAIAAIRAVWAALGFLPDQAIDDQLEHFIAHRTELSVAQLQRKLGG